MNRRMRTRPSTDGVQGGQEKNLLLHDYDLFQAIRLILLTLNFVRSSNFKFFFRQDLIHLIKNKRLAFMSFLTNPSQLALMINLQFGCIAKSNFHHFLKLFALRLVFYCANLNMEKFFSCGMLDRCRLLGNAVMNSALMMSIIPGASFIELMTILLLFYLFLEKSMVIMLKMYPMHFL